MVVGMLDNAKLVSDANESYSIASRDSWHIGT